MKNKEKEKKKKSDELALLELSEMLDKDPGKKKKSAVTVGTNLGDLLKGFEIGGES